MDDGLELAVGEVAIEHGCTGGFGCCHTSRHAGAKYAELRRREPQGFGDLALLAQQKLALVHGFDGGGNDGEVLGAGLVGDVGDRLPSLEDFLEPFVNQQFDALMAVRNTGRHRKVIDAYLQVEPDLALYEDIPACRMAFADAVSKAIRPLHQIALNQGFVPWMPRCDYAMVEIEYEK